MCIAVAFHQSASSCVFAGCLNPLPYIHIDCSDADFPRCASWYAFWGEKPYCMKSCTVCTCAVSLRCEWGSAFWKCYLDWTTCHTVGNCIAWPHCGSVCGKKVLVCLQMSWDTMCKEIVLPYCDIDKTPSPPFWVLKLTIRVGNTKKKIPKAEHSPFRKHWNAFNLRPKLNPSYSVTSSITFSWFMWWKS